MENIRRAIKIFWLEHSDPIIFFTIVIVGIILVVQFLNQLVIQKKEDEANNVIVNESSLETNLGTKENKVYTNKIKEFINYCKEEKLQEAYELISENCKNENYRTLEEFIEKYYNKIFYKKICAEIEYENTTSLYKLTFYEDPLETGILKSENNIVDHYKIEEVLENKIYINYNNIL